MNSVFISYCTSQPIWPHGKFIFGPMINVWEQGLFSFIDYNSAILYLGRSAWSWNWMFLTGVFEVLILKEIKSVYNHSSHKPLVLPWWRCFFRSWISKHRRWRSYFYPTLLLKSLASIPVGQFCAHQTRLAPVLHSTAFIFSAKASGEPVLWKICFNDALRKKREKQPITQ